jgi:hypothetical protein
VAEGHFREKREAPLTVQGYRRPLSGPSRILAVPGLCSDLSLCEAWNPPSLHVGCLGGRSGQLVRVSDGTACSDRVAVLRCERGGVAMTEVLPERQALSALGLDLPRGDLPMAAQLEYDRLRPAWELDPGPLRALPFRPPSALVRDLTISARVPGAVA